MVQLPQISLNGPGVTGLASTVVSEEISVLLENLEQQLGIQKGMKADSKAEEEINYNYSPFCRDSRPSVQAKRSWSGPHSSMRPGQMTIHIEEPILLSAYLSSSKPEP